MTDNIGNPKEEQQVSVPYFVHEGTMARMERIFKITVIALIVALMASLMALLINDSIWRRYCSTIEERYNVETNTELLQQPDSSAD